MNRALGAVDHEVVDEPAVRPRACALMPARPLSTFAPRRPGTIRAASATKDRRLVACLISRSPARH